MNETQKKECLAMNKAFLDKCPKFTDYLKNAVGSYKRRSFPIVTPDEDYPEYGISLTYAYPEADNPQSYFCFGTFNMNDHKNGNHVYVWVEVETLQKAGFQDVLNRLQILADDGNSIGATYLSQITGDDNNSGIWFWLKESAFQELEKSDAEVSSDIKQYILTKFFAEVADLLVLADTK